MRCSSHSAGCSSPPRGAHVGLTELAGFGLIVRHTVTPGHEEAFDRLVAAAVIEIRAREPGTLVYVSHSVEGEPGIRVFYELYADRAAFHTHERYDHVREFLTQRDAHIDAVTVSFLSAIDGTRT